MNWMCLTEVWLAIALFVALRCWYPMHHRERGHEKRVVPWLTEMERCPAPLDCSWWQACCGAASSLGLGTITSFSQLPGKVRAKHRTFLLAFFLYNDVFLKCDHENAIREDHAYGHVNVSTSKLRAMSVLYAPHVFFFWLKEQLDERDTECIAYNVMVIWQSPGKDCENLVNCLLP